MTQGADVMRDLFLSLADELCVSVEALIETANQLTREKGLQANIRSRVLIGLALKIESPFRSLMDDSRRGRGEAMHHLKTMVESFLYFYLVLGDHSDTTAKQLITEVCYRKKKFVRDNPEYAQSQGEDLDFWPAMLNEFESQGIRRISKKSLKDLVSHSVELKKWYSAVYAAACEPAHIADLIDFMPDPENPVIAIGVELSADLRARLAIHHGLATMFATLHALLDGNEIGLSMGQLVTFETRYEEIRSRKHPALRPLGEYST